MKTITSKKSTTLGDFITHVYDACGERKAGGIVQFALKAHLIEFREAPRIELS